jgi:hypothetical protein
MWIQRLVLSFVSLLALAPALAVNAGEALSPAFGNGMGHANQ